MSALTFYHSPRLFPSPQLSKVVSAAPSPIAWDAYLTAGADPALIAEAKATIEGLVLPDYTSDEVAAAAAKFAALQKAADAHVAA